MSTARRLRGSQAPLPDTRGRRLFHIERLECRELLAASAIPVVVNVPVDINPKDVYLEVSALLTAPYTNNQKTLLPTNSVVYYDTAIKDYALAKPEGKFTFALTATGETIELPTAQVSGGHIAIGIGSPPIVEYTTVGISTPTASTNPRNIFALFEYSYTGNELDVDLSEIDQVGFPFTITTTPAAPIPAEQGVGISIARNVMFELYQDYIKSQGSTAALFEQSYSYGAPYRLLAPQNVISGDAATPDLNKAGWASSGALEMGHIYNYWMTAENEHGESAISNMQAFEPGYKHPRFNIAYKTAVFTWDAFGGSPTKYNFYRSKSGDPSEARYIGSASASDKFFEDAGRPLGTAAPPKSGYTYNPLNQYFNNAIDAFFSHYTAKDSFQIERDGLLFTGEVGTYQENGHNYSVLDLSPTSGTYKDESFLIFRPYFSDNTNIAGMPPAPASMPHKHQTPAAMILAADGVFKSTGENPDGHDLILNDLENSIVSAFNRGIADNFSIHPSNWANEPELNTVEAIAPVHPHENNLKPNTTYYYVITAMYPDPSDSHKPANETTISLERQATTTTGNRNIVLHWTAHNKPTMYNVYRTETPGQNYQLIDHVINDISDPAKGYLDAGMRTPQNVSPPRYYAPGSTSNWYSAFLHLNSTNDLRNGVSINGLAYGFPYDDQGSQSTNFQGVFTQVDINIGRWNAN